MQRGGKFHLTTIYKHVVEHVEHLLVQLDFLSLLHLEEGKKGKGKRSEGVIERRLCLVGCVSTCLGVNVCA